MDLKQQIEAVFLRTIERTGEMGVPSEKDLEDIDSVSSELAKTMAELGLTVAPTAALELPKQS